MLLISILKTTKSVYLTRLIATNEGNTTQLAVVGENNIINLLSTKKNMVIEEVHNGIIKVDDIDVVNANSIRSVKVKLAKSKILV